MEDKLKNIKLSLFLLIIILVAYSLIEPYLLEVKQYTITSDQVPPAFDGLRIAFLSDIHRGPFVSQERMGQLVNKVNGLHPDLIALGGDYVHVERKYLPSCFIELSKLRAKYGVYGVLGNHDYYGSSDLTAYYMARAGIICLSNHSTWVNIGNQRIKLGGVGDFEEDMQDLSPTIDDVKPDDYVILLSHNPDYAETFTDNEVDLMLSGHTHGGQITLFGLWTPFNRSLYGQKYQSGLVQTSSTKVIVSNGIGTVIAPIRFGARPQIVEVTLKHEMAKK